VFSLPQEWRRTFFSWQQRHRLLVARFTFLVALTSLVALVGTVAIYFLERHAPGTEIKTVFDALYFTTVQLLTVSSSLKNPLTTGGRILNILFEIWGVLFVAGVTGAFATFFLSDDLEA
jgi:Ion channel